MSDTITEFGDFQTPLELASRVCRLLAANGHVPRTVLEPTCGVGGFLEASSIMWPEAVLSGVEINPEYVVEAAKRLSGRATIQKGDFFTFDWGTFLQHQAQPILVVGNLPWVTNATVGSIGGSNLPEKSNFQKHKGFNAITGKSNFDISEWMLIRILNWLADRKMTIALLCKTAVARKTLVHAWKNSIWIKSTIHLIDAKKEFNVSVDACLLTIEASPKERLDCPVFGGLDTVKPYQTIGYRQRHLISEISTYERYRHLIGTSPFKWRSGIKHDCSKIMEFTEDTSGRLTNNLGERVDLEDTYLFPMLKSSCIANGRVTEPRKWMLVPQIAVSESTAHIAEDAPRTWEYLTRHRAMLEKRGSSIYKDKPPFSIFGIGEYSFAPWKVAISGFYHRLEFRLVASYRDKPIVVDDTINFIPCQSREGADLLLQLLNSKTAQEFFGAFIFWDAKRPITTEILQKLNLCALAEHLGVSIPLTEYDGTKELLLA